MVREFKCMDCGTISPVRTLPPICPECGCKAGIIYRQPTDIRPPIRIEPPQWPKGIAVV